MSIGCDEAFTRFASRADDAIVIDRQSRLVNPGRPSINTNSSSQSSAASLACSEPNNSVTALMNAPSSRSAIVINLANVGPSLFVSSSTALGCVSCIAILDSRSPEAFPAALTANAAQPFRYIPLVVELTASVMDQPNVNPN